MLAEDAQMQPLVAPATGRLSAAGWQRIAYQAGTGRTGAAVYPHLEYHGRLPGQVAAPSHEPPPVTAEEALRQAEAEGLTLVKADNFSGYKCVSFESRCKAKPYKAQERRGKIVYVLRPLRHGRGGGAALCADARGAGGCGGGSSSTMVCREFYSYVGYLVK